MEVKLDIDSKRALKLLTIAVNDLIEALENHQGQLEENNRYLQRLLREGGK